MKKSQTKSLMNSYFLSVIPAKAGIQTQSNLGENLDSRFRGNDKTIIYTHYLPNSTENGFTLLEVLFSLAAIALIAGISIPIYESFQVRNDLDIAATTYAQTLRRAQTLSRAVDGDISWGVSIVSGSITLFRGTSYALRDSSFDEVFTMPASITPSGITEIVFTKFTSLPQTTGTVLLTSNINETRTITINAKGMVAY